MSEHLSDERVDAVARSGERPVHLKACAECADRVVKARGRQKLLKGFRPRTLSNPALARVEIRVLDELEKQRSLGWLKWGWVVAGVTAMWVVALNLTRAPTKPVELSAPPIASAPIFKGAQWTVYRAQGDAKLRVRADEAWKPVRAGSIVGDGAALAIENGAVWLASVPAGTRLKTTAGLLLGGKAQGVMESDGAWEVAVDATTEPRVFAVGSVWLSTTEAVFRVTKAAAQVVVDVRRGTVLVSDEPLFRNATRLDAPRMWSSPTKGLGSGSEWSAPEFPAAGAAAVLDLVGLPVGAMVQLGDAGFVPGPLSALLPVGAYDVSVRWVGQPHAQLSKVELKPGGTTWVPPTLVMEPVLPENPSAVEAIPQIVLSRRPSLMPCVDKWLKNDPNASAALELEFSISPRGQVRRVTVVKGDVPSAVQQCLVRTMRKWPFGQLGGSEDTVVTMPVTLSGTLP